ncbi:MAG: hypothetical protein WC552_04215 [Candidatus Omnitrophota bacterium]
MQTSHLKSSRNAPPIIILVVLCTLIIGLSLGAATWDINFWPTDTEVYYFDAALQVPHLKYISQLHQSFDQERVRWLHGKEMFILSASVFQRLLKDSQTIRPFLLVCLLSLSFSSILIYLIARNYWGCRVGLICYFCFVTSFWPYIYFLFARHQPLGLFFFLLAFYLLQVSGKNFWGRLSGVFSGACLCFSLYSSSISALYLPYYGAGYFFYQYRTYWRAGGGLENIKQTVRSTLPIVLGFAGVFVYFNFPHIIYNVKSYVDYVRISCDFNHFVYNQRVLQQWLPAHLMNIRGGWLWVFKYFRMIMPVIFPVFLAGNLFLVWHYFWSGRKSALKTKMAALGIILLGWSSVILAELRQVAQYGANYFTSFVGILLLIGFAAYQFSERGYGAKLSRIPRRVSIVLLSLVALTQVVWNSYVFFEDIYPTRMATTFLSKEIDRLGIKEIYVYNNHPLNIPMVDCLTPSLLKKIRRVTFNGISEVPSGYLLIPPVTGNSIYTAATGFYTDFDNDIFLNELLRKGNIQDYAVASFRTLASSRIWPHEEEILSYRYLILNQFSKDIVEKGKVWLLDAGRLKRDILKNFPSRDYIFLAQNNVRNIGAKSRVYVYKGYITGVKEEAVCSRLGVRLYKVGDPDDHLVAYLYKTDETQRHLWVPHGGQFASRPVAGREITTDASGEWVMFEFDEPLVLKPGLFFFTIYRTGAASDEHYYRIYREYFKGI